MEIHRVESLGEVDSNKARTANRLTVVEGVGEALDESGRVR